MLFAFTKFGQFTDNGQYRSIVVTCNFLTINFFCDYQLKRGALGPIRNRKTVVKIIQYRKTEKKFDQNRKPQAKLSKPIHFHIPVIKTLIDPIQW